MRRNTPSLLTSAWFVTLVCLAACASNAASTIDPAVVEKIERAFSLTICGLGYIDSRQYQLDELGDFDQMRYLSHLAHKSYTKERSEFNWVAVALIARRATPDAQLELQDLFHSSDVPAITRTHAAMNLARVFKDRTGLSEIQRGFLSPEVQVRADTLSTVSYVLDESSIDFVVTLAMDPNAYVLSRFGHLSRTSPGFRDQILPRLHDRLRETSGEDAARVAFVMLLMGDDGGFHHVRQFLLEYEGPLASEDLYQILQWNRELTKRGYLLGLDSAVHFLGIYFTIERDGWLRNTINLFSTFAEFPQRSVVSDVENLEIARNAIEWWNTNRGRVVFDSSENKFRVR